MFVPFHRRDQAQKELTRPSYSHTDTVTAMLNRLGEKALGERRASAQDRGGRRIHSRIHLTWRGFRSMPRCFIRALASCPAAAW
jgi:hypothetical protein